MTEYNKMFTPLTSNEMEAASAASSIPVPPDSEWRPEPVPPSVPPTFHHRDLGDPVATWEYRNAEGELEGYICRFDRKDADGNPLTDPITGKPAKEFRPRRWGTVTKEGRSRTGWHWKGWGDNRPLYRLPELLSRPDALVIVAEGERKADAVSALFPDAVGVAPMNGAKSPGKTDWTPLKRRKVIIATDNDDAGLSFGDAVDDLLRAAEAAEVLWLRPDRLGAREIRDGGIVPREGGCPPKFDLADALREGWTADMVTSLRTDPTFFTPYRNAAARALDEADPLFSGGAEDDGTEQKKPYEWPFRLDPQGVRRRVELKDGSVDWVWFCSPLEVAAFTRDATGEAWGRLLVVTDRDGHQHAWAMPMELLAGSGEEYRARLLHLGLILAPGHTCRGWLSEYIQTARPNDRARCVNRIGWHGRSFVLPDTTLGSTGGERVLLQTVDPREHAFRVRGTLEGWQERLARFAVGNSRLAFSLSAAFAAPLLYLTDTESGGFHLRGPSSIGKSTALVVSGSVWGGGGIKGYIRQWRTTDNALEALAEAHSDALLCLDELSQIDAKAAGASAYMLANGAGKGRANRAGKGRPVAEWRTLFLSNGEIGIADKLAEEGRKAAAGQQVRVVDIPADAGAGFGLFETLHGFPSADAFARHLKTVAAEHYGVAAHAFLAKVADDLEAVAEAVAGHRAAFVAKRCPAGADGQVSRVASRFGLVAAAGELAAAMGILPWESGEAMKAADRCFSAWLAARGGHGAAEVQAGIAAVRRFIELHGESRFTPWDGEETDFNPSRTVARAGFRRSVPGKGIEYYVLPEAWRTELCAGLDPTMVARALADRGMLKVGGDGKPQSKHRLPGMAKPIRVYHLTAAILGDDDA